MRKVWPFLRGACLGLAYGVSSRLLGSSPVLFLMSGAFILLVPGTMGYLAVRSLVDPPWWEKIWVSWLPWLCAVALAWLVGQEGAICIVLATPAALVMATMGGFLAETSVGRSRPTLPLLLALPLVAGPIEARWERPPTCAKKLAPASHESSSRVTIA